MKYTHRIRGLVNELHSAGHNFTVLESKWALLRELTNSLIIISLIIQTSNTSYSDLESKLIVYE